MSRNFPNVLIAVSVFGTEILLDGPEQMREMMDGPLLDENAYAGVPTQPGVYRCEVQAWKDAGNCYFRVLRPRKVLGYVDAE